MSSRLFGKKKEKETSEERFFLKNGAAVLEQLISSLNGDCNPIRNYSAQQLKTATNNFHLELKLHEGHNFVLYIGNHEDREIAVKKFEGSRIIQNHEVVQEVANEVAIASGMSSHNNVLKLLGCCLETELPILVYAYPKMGNLADCLYGTDRAVPLALELRLRIAMKVANAVAYLHHGLSKKFIHRDIRPGNIFLDRNFEPKLFDFERALSIPEGENHVEVDQVFGSLGFLAPEVFTNYRYSEKTDVYAFGGLLCEILTKKGIFYRFAEHLSDSDASLHSSVSDTSLYSSDSDTSLHSSDFDTSLHSSIVPFLIAKASAILLQEENRAQVMEAIKLMEACLRRDPDDRPDMIEVAKALRLIISS